MSEHPSDPPVLSDPALLGDILSIAFVIQPHFSMMAFTAAADALTTANLVRPQAGYRFQTISTDGPSVVSDLGIFIEADASLTDWQHNWSSTHAIIVCGGYRCELTHNPRLTTFLKQASQNNNCMIGGLWNGVIPVAHAQLMDGFACALHPNDHDTAKQLFPNLEIRTQNTVIDRNRLSAAGPSSSLDLMLALIQRHDGAETVQAVRDILRADINGPDAELEALARDAEHYLPPALQTALLLMRNNLDEPIEREELAMHVNLSTRALERLFQKHLQTSPARHYLELRLQSARAQLVRGHESIGSVALATGFISGSHFSRAFSKRFGQSPRELRDLARTSVSQTRSIT